MEEADQLPRCWLKIILSVNRKLIKYFLFKKDFFFKHDLIFFDINI